MVVFASIVAIILIQFLPSTARPDVHPAPVNASATTAASTSPETLIDDFDKIIQQRFLTSPGFGFARLVFVPVRPTGPKPGHVDSFNPSSEAELSAVAGFEKEGWDVGLYLFGRRVQPRTKTEKENDYDIRYRLFNPIPVTKGLKRSSFPKQKKLANEAKQAFLEFQRSNKNEMRFDVGEWSYIARPVRVANQTCLQCHTDLVITDKTAEGKFTARPRRIGDVNGVLFYALRKHAAKN
jgi:hypothetical protein